jgi:anaerobic ribonucleoside-triphosphate reductase activating protein
LIDILVDGRFLETQKDLTLQFRGSSNQRIIDVPKSLAANKVIIWDKLIR